MNVNIDEKQVVVGEVSTPAMIDKTLGKVGFAADAAEVGRRLSILEKRLNELNPITAEALKYDGSEGGLEADNVQGALNEMSANVAHAVSKVDEGLEEALGKIDTKMGEYAKVSDKPSGKYIGNGSTAERVIDIGGQGNVLIVYTVGSATDSRSFMLVFPMGAYGHSGTGGSIAFSGSAVVNFENGNLTLKTSSACLNKKDIEYFYQVL